MKSVGEAMSIGRCFQESVQNRDRIGALSPTTTYEQLRAVAEEDLPYDFLYRIRRPGGEIRVRGDDFGGGVKLTILVDGATLATVTTESAIDAVAPPRTSFSVTAKANPLALASPKLPRMAPVSAAGATVSLPSPARRPQTR